MKPAAAGAVLRVEGVSKAFEGVQALDGVGFEVCPGTIKALIGPNGAGKTTLLNVINGLLAPDAGSVAFLGEDVTGLDAHKLALRGLSRTFQLIRLFTVNRATVLDNVLIGAHGRLQPSVLGAVFARGAMRRHEEEARERALELLKFVGLGDSADRLPGSLPFGDQRLVELARSLMAEPKLLLLDEPASGLNDAETESFMGLLAAIRGRGVTILLVEHNMKLVMNVSDDIVVLDFGRRLAEGDPATICANPDVVQAYLGAEACRIAGRPGC